MLTSTALNLRVNQVVAQNHKIRPKWPRLLQSCSKLAIRGPAHGFASLRSACRKSASAFLSLDFSSQRSLIGR